ncbi:MAG TPA: hypothetical protein VFA41_12220 [Ktedonobacteraceae bacterium]|jgi:hypothetical protein|nr:hypothetical protein [Ktedonobacteraceae bacterium]
MQWQVKPEASPAIPEPTEAEVAMSEGQKMSSKSQEKKIRVQFEFAPEALARLDALKEVTDAPTRAETVRSALRFYEWLVNEAKRDYMIATINEQGKIVSQFPARLLMR